MKSSVEDALARGMSEAMPSLALCAPQYAVGEIPDAGTSLVVTADIEHRAGPVHLADVTFTLQTVADGDVAAQAHREYEQAVKIAASAVVEIDCGMGLALTGTPFFLGQGGGLDGNRWSSEIKVRYGLIETL